MGATKHCLGAGPLRCRQHCLSLSCSLCSSVCAGSRDNLLTSALKARSTGCARGGGLGFVGSESVRCLRSLTERQVRVPAVCSEPRKRLTWPRLSQFCADLPPTADGGDERRSWRGEVGAVLRKELLWISLGRGRGWSCACARVFGFKLGKQFRYMQQFGIIKTVFRPVLD